MVSFNTLLTNSIKNLILNLSQMINVIKLIIQRIILECAWNQNKTFQLIKLIFLVIHIYYNFWFTSKLLEIACIFNLRWSPTMMQIAGVIHLLAHLNLQLMWAQDKQRYSKPWVITPPMFPSYNPTSPPCSFSFYLFPFILLPSITYNVTCTYSMHFSSKVSS